MFTWLHLSDLHLCGPKTGWDADRILKSLLIDLRGLERDHGLCPDLLLVSGDLAFGHLGEGDLSIQAQFEETALFLEEVRAAFSHPIPVERVFLVPGNHDVARNTILPSQTDYLDKLAAGDYSQSARTINQWLRDASGEWPALMQRLEAYKTFLSEHYPHLLQDNKRLCYAQIVEINGLCVGIAGLNSAWSCGRDQEKGKLWLGGEWQLRTLSKQLEQASIRLAMAHHPLTWLVAQENPKIDPELQKEFDFFLHGHEHQSWVEEKPRHVRLAAGACYGETPAESGYSFVRLNPADGTGEVWLRRFSDEGLGWIPRVIPQRTNNNGLWPLKLEWLKPQAEITPEPAAMPAKKAEPPPAQENSTPPLSGPEARGVFGRGAEIAKLAKQLQDKPILLIHGVAGIGKSKLIREMCRELPGAPQYVPITVTSHTNADEFFQFLAPSLGCHDARPMPPRNLLRQIDIKALNQYIHAEPCAVHVHLAHELFSENGFNDPELRTLLRGLAKQLSHWRFVLESTKHAPAELLPEEVYSAERVWGLDAAAVRDYFRQPFGPANPRGWPLKAEDAQGLYLRLGGKDERTGAHPLGMALLASVADGLGRGPLEVVRDYPEEFYKSFEQRLFNDLYQQVLSPPQQHLLRLCCLYRRPIPDAHVESLLQRVKDSGAFRTLLQRFLLSPDQGQEHYTLHSLFADLAEKRLKGGSDLQGDHAVIAEAYLRQVGSGHWDSLPRMLAANEAAHHLLLAEEFHRLHELSHTLLGWDTPFKLSQWSERLFKREDYENDRHVLELLVKLEPDNHKAHRFLGERIEQLDGRGTDEALEHHLRAFELYSSFPAYLANVGRCLEKRWEYGRFVALVDGLDPYNREKAVDGHVQTIYSRCLERIGQGDKGSQERQQMIQQGRADAHIFNDEVVYLREQGRYATALKVLEKAEQAGVMDEHLRAVKAGILQDSGDGAAASRLRQERIAAGEHDAIYYSDEALYQWHTLHDPAAALALLEQAEAAGCADDYTWATKAKLLEHLGRRPEASRLRRGRIDAGSRDAALYNDEAVYLRELGDYDSALAVLELAERNRCADPAYVPNIRRSIQQRRSQAESRSASPQKTAAMPELNHGPHIILVLAANPFKDLNLDEEIRAIQAGLQRARERDSFHFVHHPACRAEDWRRALLDHRPTVVQFSGHGLDGQGIVLFGADGQAQAVSAEALGTLFALFKDKVRCVLLNACYSHSQAEAIAQHIPYVVGMSEDITDEAAREFSTAFYDALGAGEDFAFAYRMGCNALDFHSPTQSGLPVLYQNGEVNVS